MKWQCQNIEGLFDYVWKGGFLTCFDGLRPPVLEKKQRIQLILSLHTTVIRYKSTKHTVFTNLTNEDWTTQRTKPIPKTVTICGVTPT